MADRLAEQELLFLIYKYIDTHTPCDETKKALKNELVGCYSTYPTIANSYYRRVTYYWEMCIDGMDRRDRLIYQTWTESIKE